MISEAEAFARKKDTDPLRGNTITMTSQCTGECDSFGLKGWPGPSLLVVLVCIAIIVCCI